MLRNRIAAVSLSCLFAIPAVAQERFAGSDALDRAIEDSIAAGQIPGAVLLVGQSGKVLHRKAYGSRALVPAREEMTLDTIFDAASLTKIVATTSSLMKLEEEGRVRIADRVTQYLPRFQGGKSDITVRHLLTHFAGLRPDLDLEPEWSGYQTGIDRALVDKLTAAPGERFVYSDIGFVLLGEIVRVASGQPLNVYARENIFLPAGMNETTFLPPASLRPRIAPTERVKGEVLRGVVHDPTARYMGGVAGHAGLFTTAADLARWAEMLINGGEIGGKRIFSPLTIRKFTEPNSPPHQAILRGLGFDLDSPYSGNRGELFPLGSFGHTGFTGTSVWIDPSTKAYVILLANSVHPERRPPITPLRGKVATIAAAALGIDVQGISLTSYLETNDAAPRRAIGRAVETQTGIDVLAADGFARLQGKRVGLITNHTGLTAGGKRNIDVMLGAGVHLTALFSPEHGLAGREDQENVAHGKDEASGLPVWSLYQGKDRRPSDAMLREVDVLVFDIQDVGARFYTYLSTMMYAMQAAAKAGLPFVVLDRPNPISGLHPEGPMLDADQISFVGCSVLPLRHAMTLGELARYLNVEEKIGARLEVVAMKNWRRGDWWDSTGLNWIDPSPNMRSLNAALLYTGVALIEYARNYSVGRGTDAPFEQIGADWMNGRELAGYLNRRLVPGVRFYAARFRPTASNFQEKTIEGVRLVITDRESFSPLRTGLEIAVALEKLYPGKIDFAGSKRLIGSQAVIDAIRAGEDPRAIESRANAGLAPFLEKRSKYLLYK
jgi:uncharacterized protein YbbC (DUF1343 family)